MADSAAALTRSGSACSTVNAMVARRADEDWDVLTRAAVQWLEQVARLQSQSTYTELNQVLSQRTGLPRFDFDLESERADMGRLLGRVTAETFDRIGAMLSSLVVYLNANDAGPGFYKLAIQMELFPPAANADQRLEFWIGQVRAVHDYYAGR